MKKAMIALSAILVAAPVFAATTHATDDTVAAANANANTAKEKRIRPSTRAKSSS